MNDSHISQSAPNSAPEAGTREAELLLALQQVKAAFHVNMLRAFPEKSHADIAAEIDRACDTHAAANAAALSDEAIMDKYGQIVAYPERLTSGDYAAAIKLVRAFAGNTPAAADAGVQNATGLLQCPFCGSTDVAHQTFDEDNSREFVMCNGCGVCAQRNDCEADPVEVWNHRAPATSAAALPVEHVTMNGHQLKQALALAWPDGDADPMQGETVVNITRWPAGKAADEDGALVDMPAGLYLAYDDLPREGMTLLPDEAEGDIPAAKGTAGQDGAA